jgi:hypothetical protein
MPRSTVVGSCAHGRRGRVTRSWKDQEGGLPLGALAQKRSGSCPPACASATMLRASAAGSVIMIGRNLVSSHPPCRPTDPGPVREAGVWVGHQARAGGKTQFTRAEIEAVIAHGVEAQPRISHRRARLTRHDALWAAAGLRRLAARLAAETDVRINRRAAGRDVATLRRFGMQLFC